MNEERWACALMRIASEIRVPLTCVDIPRFASSFLIRLQESTVHAAHGLDDFVSMDDWGVESLGGWKEVAVEKLEWFGQKAVKVWLCLPFPLVCGVRVTSDLVQGREPMEGSAIRCR